MEKTLCDLKHTNVLRVPLEVDLASGSASGGHQHLQVLDGRVGLGNADVFQVEFTLCISAPASCFPNGCARQDYSPPCLSVRYRDIPGSALATLFQFNRTQSPPANDARLPNVSAFVHPIISALARFNNLFAQCVFEQINVFSHFSSEAMALSAPRIFHPRRVSCAAVSSNSLPKSTRVLFASLASCIVEPVLRYRKAIWRFLSSTRLRSLLSARAS